MKLPLLVFAAGAVLAQAPPNVVKVEPAATVTIKTGATADIAMTLNVDAGYHVNSNAPNDPYLIPLSLTWDNSLLQAEAPSFPTPKLETIGFSSKPLSVFTVQFQIVTRVKAPRAAKVGTATLAGKLHYQACNDRTCLPPRATEVRVPIEVIK